MTNDFGRTFRDEIGRQSLDGAADVTPTVISQAARAALGAAGAGMTLMEVGLRLPVGATDERVEVAEQLQATLGEGPCLSAARDNSLLAVTEAGLAARWPAYHDNLRRRTPFRSVLAIPLWDGERSFAAINLYATETMFPNLPALPIIRTRIGVPASALMLGAVEDLGDGEVWDDDRLQQELAGATLGRRLRVWTAVGMIMEASGLPDSDALAVLRAHAYSNDLSLDTVGQRVVDRLLSSGAVLGR